MRAAATAWLALGVLGGCTGRPLEPALDLITLWGEAEVRSDALDLPLLLAQPDFKQRGWVETSEHGRPLLWSRRRDATLRLPFATVGAKQLRLGARCDAALAPGVPLRVSLNGLAVGSLELTPVEQEFSLALSASVQQPGDNLLTLEVPRQREPGRGDPEQLPLAVGIGLLQIRTEGTSPPTLQDRALWLPGRASVGFYLRPAPGSALEIEAQGQVAVAADTGSGAQTLGQVASERRRFDLPPAPAGFVRASFTNTGTGGATLRVAQLLSPPSAAPAPAGEPLAAPRPNIVVFLVDTLRADHLGAYGHRSATSPRFDAFAQQALLFQDAWAQAPWTRPAVASIFTGLQPASHGVDGVDRILAPALGTLAESLRAAGYRTGAFVANHLVNARYGFDQGFETWNDGDPQLGGVAASTLAARALAFVDRARPPFFLYVHTLDPHSPYEPGEESWAPLRPPLAPAASTRALLLKAHRNDVTPDEMRYLRSAYEGEVRQNDTGFGALVDGLRARGRLDDSLLLFTADHGEEFQEHGGMEHAHTVYQELLHVPLAVRLPGARRGGQRDPRPVEQIDLMPTLLAFAGVAPPAGLQGRDLSQRWLGEAAGGETPLLWSETRFGNAHKYAVRAGNWKLIVNSDRRALWRAGVPLELYDLAADPGEQRECASAQPIITGYLRRRVTALLALQERLRLRAAGERITLSEEDQEQLRALGYVQ